MSQGGIYGGEFPSSYQLYVNGELDHESVAAYVNQMFEWDQDDPDASWQIVINSPGGETESGTALYETIASYSRRGGGSHFVTTVASGECSSMAVLVSQAGDWRVTGRLTVWVMHECSMGPFEAPLSEVATNLDVYQRFSEEADLLTLERTNITLEGYRKHIDGKQWMLLGSELLYYGFVDEVRESKPQDEGEQNG